MRWCTKIDKYQVCCSKASLSCIVNAPQSGLTLWKSLSLERSKPDRRYRWLFLAQSFFSASASFFRRIAFFGVVELFLAPRLAPRHPRQIILLFNHCSVTKNSGINKPWVEFSNKETLTSTIVWGHKIEVETFWDRMKGLYPVPSFLPFKLNRVNTFVCL